MASLIDYMYILHGYEKNLQVKNELVLLHCTSMYIYLSLSMATGGLSPSTAPSWEILHPVPLQGTGGTHTLASATCLHVNQLKIYRYHKNLGVKEGGWGLLKGVIFWELGIHMGQFYPM